MSGTLPTERAGLRTAEATTRRTTAGPNRLPPPRHTPALLRLAHQLVHFFAVMLWTAAVLAWFAGLPELAIAIAAVVVLNALFAFAQEHRADRAADRLRELLPDQITVRRDLAAVRIDVVDIVPGDVVLLEAGDRVPADADALVADGLMLDTAMLTGESGAVAVGAGDRLYAGTFVVEGEAEALVTATGAGTRLARIAALTSSGHKPETPLTRELTRVVRTLAGIALGVGAGFFVLAWTLGHPVDEGLVFAIGVTVALVPEALLPTVTLSLAWGAERMADREVLVRNLEAVETLGSTTFICTDKTGTLTRNEMEVVEAWTPVGTAIVSGEGYSPTATVVLSDPAVRPALTRLARAAALASTGAAVLDGERWQARGDPMEAALDVLARRLGIGTAGDRVGAPAVSGSRSIRVGGECRSSSGKSWSSRAHPTPCCHGVPGFPRVPRRRSTPWRARVCACSLSPGGPSRAHHLATPTKRSAGSCCTGWWAWRTHRGSACTTHSTAAAGPASAWRC